jgi:hypothetical protein
MLGVFFAFPAILTLLTAVLYRFSGRKELYNLDLVQVLYMFVFGPLFFVWGKAMLLFLLFQQVNLFQEVTVKKVFLIDSIYSILFLIVYAFNTIHSLTKSFSLKKKKNRQLDIFLLAEYFHLDFSHLFIFAGGVFILTFLGLVNAFFPVEDIILRPIFFVALGFSVAAGVAYARSIYNYYKSIKERRSRKFRVYMTAAQSICVLMLLVTYFVLELGVDSRYIFFWLSSFCQMGACAFFITRIFSSEIPARIRVRRAKAHAALQKN